MNGRDLIRFGLDASFSRAMRCVDDLSDEEARRSPHGLSPIVWQLGHLALSDNGYLSRIGAQPSVPGSYVDLFKSGSGGQADYPRLHDVRMGFTAGQHALEELLLELDIAREVDARNYKTVGEMLIFAAYHRGYHIGKMTTLRALLAKPRLFG